MPNLRTITGFSIFEHLLVACRVPRRKNRPAPDHQVDALRLAGIIVVEQELRLLGQDRFAVLAIAVCRAAGRPDDLLRRNAVGASE